jgi:hypothetical protein
MDLLPFISPAPFFNPAPEFLAWMAANYGSKAIIDAGCGYGNFTEALILNGCPGAVGLDLMHDKIAAGVTRHPAAVTRLLYGDTAKHGVVKLPDAVIVFARPCHSAQWIADTVKHAKATASAFLYISAPGNAAMDLPGFERRRHCVGMEVGDGNEEVWEFRPVPAAFAGDAPVRWCLVEREPGKGAAWKRDGRNCWFHGWGRPYQTQTDAHVVLQDAWVQDDNWLDHTLTATHAYWSQRVTDTSLDNAWVSPTGEVYRCAYWEHDALVYSYLRMHTHDLEDAGWCKVQRSGRNPHDRDTMFVVRDRKGRIDAEGSATKEQVRALLTGGWKPPFYFLEAAEGDWSKEVQAELATLGVVELEAPDHN